MNTKTTYKAIVRVALILILVTSLVFIARDRVAAGHPSDSHAQLDVDELIASIRSGRGGYDAVRLLGDRVARLRDELHQVIRQETGKGSGQYNAVVVHAARNALAKMGDWCELQRIISGMHSKNLAMVSKSIDDGLYVGGNRIVVALGDILFSNAPGGRWSLPSPGTHIHLDDPSLTKTDLGWRPPRIMAAKALAQLVSHPPVPPIGKDKKFYTKGDVSVWRTWWKQHKKDYMCDNIMK